eukprot:SAG31_NODE_62_length_28678_cov_21.548270_13_plen_201_part_00
MSGRDTPRAARAGAAAVDPREEPRRQPSPCMLAVRAGGVPRASSALTKEISAVGDAIMQRAILSHLRPTRDTACRGPAAAPAGPHSCAVISSDGAVVIPPWSLEDPHGGLADEVVGPDYAPSREVAGTGDAARSTVFELAMDSSDSKIYAGVDRRPGIDDAADAAMIHDPRFRGLGLDPGGFGEGCYFLVFVGLFSFSWD